jgi:hypothetical protein
MKYKKEIVIVAIVAIFIFSSGCMGIQAPIFPKGAIGMNVPIQKAPNGFIDQNAPAPTPTVNVTVTQTTKPKFVYV